MAHVAEYKKKVVQEYSELLSNYPIVGAVNLENMPAAQLQNMRSLLRDTVVLRMSKRRIITIALNQCKEKGLDKLLDHLRGMPALLFTKENPFKLYKTIQKNKSKAPAKGGQIAPNDIIVNAGPTSFAPGPIIGELGALGLKTGVENGKIVIKDDKVVVKEGEVIEQKTAEILTRLGIEPMEVGLDLVAIFEDQTIYTKDVLTIDEDEFMNNLVNAAKWALNLSVESAYTVKDNIEILISNSFKDARGLAISECILSDGVVSDILGKAERQMLSLAGVANIEVREIEHIKKENLSQAEIKVQEIKEEVNEIKDEVRELKQEIVDPALADEAEDVEKVKDQVKKIVKEKINNIENEEKDIEEDIKKGKDQQEIIKKEAILKDKADSIKKDIQDLKIDKVEIDPIDDPTAKLIKDAAKVTEVVKEIDDRIAKASKKIPEIKDVLEREGKEVKNLATGLLEEEKKIESEVKIAEKMLKKLQSKGTLRDAQSKTKSEHVPTAHELAKKIKK